MKKFFVILFSLLLCTTISFADQTEKKEDPYKKPINIARKSSISIFSIGRGGTGRCSGVVLNNHKKAKILTAKHCIYACEEMYVENVPVEFIVISTDDDLALLILETEIVSKRPVKLANYLLENSLAIHIGYPNGKEYIRKGNIFLTAQDWTFVSLESRGGCSGGGVFNTDGELIGILWGRLLFEKTSMFEPIKDVKRFLKKVDQLIKL